MSIRRSSGTRWRPRARRPRRRRPPLVVLRGRLRALVVVGTLAVVAIGGAAFLGGGSLPPSGAGGDYVGPAGSGGPVRPAPDIDPRWYGAAPYVMPLGGPTLPDVIDATGQRTFGLAFILASGNSCAPAWDGTRPVGPDNRVAAVIDAVRAKGGDVSVSFGGGLGTRLGQTCRNAEETAHAYQEVIDRYRLRAVDFDLEDPEWRDDEAVARELGAAKILVANNPGLYLSLTLPMLRDQVPERAVHVLAASRSIGLQPDNVSVMPFDFHGQGPMGDAAIDALEAMHGQLMSTFAWSAAEAYRREGASLMNGRTDHGEFFMPADFQTVLDYATSHGLGRFTFWSINRDRQCDPIDNGGKTSGSCSSVEQDALRYTRFTASFGALATGR